MVVEQRKNCYRKFKLFLLGLAALLFGLLIYLLFRPNTYISKFVSSFISINIPDFIFAFECDFLKFYLVDYLWAFSFGCFFKCIFIDSSINRFIIYIVAIFGILYEIIQCFGIVSGTGDILDCLLYLLAGLTVNILNI